MPGEDELYQTVSMSHQFLTGMTALLYPDVVGEHWDREPYIYYPEPNPVAEEQSLLMSEECRKDLKRTCWHFGKRDRSKAEEGFKPKVDDLGVVEALMKFAENRDLELKEENKIKLTEPESTALWVFGKSVGERHFLQGGAFNGIVGDCFKSTWLQGVYGITFEEYNHAYIEGQRIEGRSSDGLQVSSYIEIKEVFGIDSPPAGTSVIKFCSTQHVKQQQNEKGEIIFSLVPHSQTLQIEKGFWNNHMLPQAMKRLKGVENFTNEDFFAFIPCLSDKNFKQAFCEKLATRPQAEYDSAMKWIKVCYNGKDQEQELKTILNLLEWERKIAPVKNFINANRTIVVGLALGTLGAGLAATGVLAPVGAALGWTLTAASPMEALAVGGVCFAAPAVAKLSRGIVGGCKALAKVVSRSFSKSQSEEENPEYDGLKDGLKGRLSTHAQVQQAAELEEGPVAAPELPDLEDLDLEMKERNEKADGLEVQEGVLEDLNLDQEEDLNLDQEEESDLDLDSDEEEEEKKDRKEVGFFVDDVEANLNERNAEHAQVQDNPDLERKKQPWNK